MGHGRHGRHGLHSNPMPRTFIGDGVSPAACARGATEFMTPIRDGTCPRDHYNSRSAIESGLVRNDHVTDNFSLP